MKKIILAIALIISLQSMAQTEKGSVLIGGGFSLLTGEGSSQFIIDPTVGYFFANNFTIGLSAGYNYQKLGTVKSNEFGIGPFARYYIGSNATKPFVVTEFDFLTNSTKSSTVDIKTNGTRFLFGLGFAAFVNETVAVEGLTGYSYSKFKDTDGSGGFNLRLGFGIYFNKNSAKDLKKNVMGDTN